jgi:hypothetical protein
MGKYQRKERRGERVTCGYHVLVVDMEYVLTMYFGTPSLFIILWFGFDYGTNPPLGTLII